MELFGFNGDLILVIFTVFGTFISFFFYDEFISIRSFGVRKRK